MKLVSSNIYLYKFCILDVNKTMELYAVTTAEVKASEKVGNLEY
jgi:hypothetical protein